MLMQTFSKQFVFTVASKEIFNHLKHFCGGQSIVLGCRYHEAGKTFLRHPIYNKDKKNEVDKGWSMSNDQSLTGIIAAYDENQQYPTQAAKPQMCGKPIYYEFDDNQFEEAKITIEGKFGMIVCDYHVPESLYEKFGVFQPCFKNIDVSMTTESVGSYMMKIKAQLGIKTTASRKLIGSFHDENATIHTSLYAWYVKNGFIIDKIHAFIEYQPCDLFSEDILMVADIRRRADLPKEDPNHLSKTAANTWKLVLNSFIGTTIMNKGRQHEIVVSDSEKVYNKNAMSSRLIDIESIPVGSGHRPIYEMCMHKKKIQENKPIQIGAAVYSLAKLNMLEFVFDFLYKHIPRSEFCEMHTDTDSIIIALSTKAPIAIRDPKKKDPDYIFEDEPNIHITGEHIGVDLLRRICIDKDAFDRDAPKYLVYNAYDARTPGLFKIEKLALSEIDLCPKTYYSTPLHTYKIDGDQLTECKGKDNITMKGVGSRNREDTQRSDYMNAIINGATTNYTNVGFRFIAKIGSEVTYEQTKIGITPIYTKKRVCANGIDCLPTLL